MIRCFMVHDQLSIRPWGILYQQSDVRIASAQFIGRHNEINLIDVFGREHGLD